MYREPGLVRALQMPFLSSINIYGATSHSLTHKSRLRGCPRPGAPGRVSGLAYGRFHHLGTTTAAITHSLRTTLIHSGYNRFARTIWGYYVSLSGTDGLKEHIFRLANRLRRSLRTGFYQGQISLQPLVSTYTRKKEWRRYQSGLSRRQSV